MLDKLCAVWFVVVSVLPFTAPFTSLDAADLAGDQSTMIEVSHLTTPTIGCASESTALVSDRSGLTVVSKLTLLPIAGSYDAAAPDLRVVSDRTLPTDAYSPASRITILRV